MEVEHWGGELEEHEDGAVGVDEGALGETLERGFSRGGGKLGATYETQRKHNHRTGRMHQEPNPKNIKIPRTHRQIPDKIPQRKRLQRPAQPRIPKHGMLDLRALPVRKQDVQAEDTDKGGLHQGNDVYVPVDARARGERGVVQGEEARGDGPGEEEDEVVGDEGDEHFVDVEGEGVQV